MKNIREKSLFESDSKVRYRKRNRIVDIFSMSASILLIAIFLVSCSENSSKNKVVASVNDMKITADEVALAYEFAPRKITQQGKEKAMQIILDGIIKKQLFAEEAKKYGLQNNAFVQESVDYFARAAVNRELYLKHVRDSININQEELHEAYERSKTTLFVKHFITSDHDIAEQIALSEADAKHVGLLDQNKTINFPEFGLADMICFNDLNKEMEDILYALPIFQLSEPYYDGKQYHVFRVIDKSIDRMLTEEDFLQKKESLSNVLRKRKEHQVAFRFVNRVMKPQNLVIKADAINWIIAQLEAQNNDKIRPRYLNDKELQSLENKEMLKSNLAEFKSGTLTIEDFQKIYRMNPIQVSMKNQNTIRNNLKNIIAIYVRDKVFSEIGIAENLDKKPSVQDEKKYWETRLLANEMKKKIFQEIQTETADSLNMQDIYNQEIESFSQKLYATSRIEIDNEKLKNVETTDDGLSRKIDFFAKHMQ